ncbi:hypothetical protein [Flavobacterium haoranii]|uniref:Lipoprotein n=1 Tax=Flavobacterium haoranii TaxID=683124 RepID=A0A1M6E220_9FLAO|nr:hypothetical protein [Flavobacterium haoranii]SHI79318.1 hypothetical protein SAMN05444337_0813 [Flavobacterium haoranii]
MVKFISFISVLVMLSCSCKQNLDTSQKTAFEVQEIIVESLTYQSWVAGVQGGGSGINVTVNFKNALPKDVVLKSLKLLQYTTYNITAQDEKIYLGYIRTEANQRNFDEKITDEVKVQTKPIENGKAILVFEKNGKVFEKEVQNVKKLEMLAYPTAKPRN